MSRRGTTCGRRQEPGSWTAKVVSRNLDINTVDDSRPELLVDVAPRDGRHHGAAVRAEDLALGASCTDRWGHRGYLVGPPGGLVCPRRQGFDDCGRSEERRVGKECRS